MRPRHPAALATLVLLTGCNTCGETPLQQATPLITPSSSTLEFGSVFVGADRVAVLEVQSTGTATVHIADVRIVGDAVFTTQAVGPQALAPRDSFSVPVRFAPAQVGEVTAQLVIENDSTNLRPLLVNLRGTGLAQLDCDDQNVCTDDTFDAAAGVCLRTNNTAPCDSGSRCTRDDRCVGGQCLGLPTDCSDDNACTRDLCDATVGCVFLPVNCEEGNTCTLDTCDVLRGCQHRALPDGTPCEDGNLCSVADTCAQGTCRGGPPTVDPAPVGVAFGYGARGSAVVLDDTRVVFFDQLTRASGPFIRATVTQRTGNVLRHVRTTTLDAVTDLFFFQVLANGIIASTTSEGSYTFRVHLWAVDTDGTVREAGRSGTFGSSSGGTSLVGGASRGSIRYLAGTTGVSASTLIAIDATDPANPVVRSQALPYAVRGLAVDEVHDLLLAGGDDGIMRLSLADPAAPVMVDFQLAGTGIYQIATNGIVTSVCRVASPRLVLLDAATGMIRQAVPSLANETPCSEISQPAFMQAGNLLFALSGGQLLYVYDVGAPEVTGPVASGILPAYGTGLSAGGTLDVVVTVGPFVLMMERSPLGLAPVGGPGNGRLEHLLQEGGSLFAVSSDGAHQLDLSVPAAPRFVQGRRFPQQAALVSLSSQLRTPTLPTAGPNAGPARDPAVLHELGSAVWMDASDLDNPRPLATVAFPPSVGPRRSMRTDGRRIYTTNQTAGMQSHYFGIINPDDAPGSGNITLSHAATMDLPVPPGFHAPPTDFIAVDSAASHVAVSIPDYLNFQFPDGVDESQLLVVDVADPASLRLLVNATLGYVADGLALSGQVVAAVERSTPEPRVHIYAWDGAQPTVTTQRAVLEVPGFSHFLLMDEHVLLMSTADGVAFINLVTQPPTLLGQVSTPESRPLSALVQGQHLLLGFPGEVLVLTPPCPVSP